MRLVRIHRLDNEDELYVNITYIEFIYRYKDIWYIKMRSGENWGITDDCANMLTHLVDGDIFKEVSPEDSIVNTLRGK